MPGYKILNNKLTEQLLADHLQKSSNPLAQYFPKPSIETVTQEVFNTSVGSEELYINPFKYYTDPTKNLIIITTPIAANNFADLLPHLDKLFPGKQLLLGLDGRGATEQHIVTTYISADKKTVDIFDPKASNAIRFFSGKGGTGTLLLGLLRALNPFPKSTLTFGEVTANYYALGTQSFFDGVSCGYHNVAAILACKELLEDGAITRDNLLAKIKNPVSEATQLLKEKAPKKVDSNFASFVKKAWQDTMMPVANKEQRQLLKFQNYFLGWPYQGTTNQKIIYFVTLRFLFQPIINLIRRPIEFSFNLLSETANFLKNTLINWAPTHLSTQYLRSGLMLLTYAAQGLFKGAYLLLRTFTSPMVNFELLQARKNPQAAREAHPIITESTVSAPLHSSDNVLSDGSNVVALFKEKGVSTAPNNSLSTNDFEDVIGDGFTAIDHPKPVLPGRSRDSQFGATDNLTEKKGSANLEGTVSKPKNV